MGKDANHPLVLVSLGLDLYHKGGDYTVAYGSYALLSKAKEIFDNRMNPRYMSTHYAEQWVEYWMPQIKNKFLELANK